MDKLFVAIASYRDPECQWTVKDLFAAARHPERINVGICWQFDPERDLACFQEAYPFPNQVRQIDVRPADARGACWAKAQALSLRTDEEFVLLIDSHMRFAQDWDVAMHDQWQSIGNPRAFLSTYPAGYEPPNERRFCTPRLAPVKFFDRVLSQDSVLLDMAQPLPSYLVAGGFLFAPREMFDQVPYDPHIYFIGEEIAHAARYYTHGWDGYAPHKCIIHHYYARKTAAKHWQDEKEAWARLNDASYKRVRHLLGVERTADAQALLEFDRYSLGGARSLDDFQAAIGVNINAQVIDRKRQESIAAIEAAQKRPVPPASRHDTDAFALAATRHGQLLVPKRDSYIGKSLLEYGEWTEDIVRLCAALFPAGATVVEIGACFGARTVALARLVGNQGRLIAVEQSRRLADVLHGNLALNRIDWVDVVRARMGQKPGAVVVTEPNFDADGNFGMLTHRAADAQAKRPTPQLVTDEQTWGRIDHLSIDTPGSVHDVLKGAQQALATHRPSILINADNPTDTQQATALLTEAGFFLWRYSSPFFRDDNFLRKPDNVFGGLASNCLVALPDQRDLSPFGASRWTAAP